MEITKLHNNWYSIKKTNIFRKMFGLKPTEKKYKHLVDNVFSHAVNSGVYMSEDGKILSPFYDKKVDLLDEFRMKLKYK